MGKFPEFREMSVVMTSVNKKIITILGLTVNHTMLESHTMQCGHSVIKKCYSNIVFLPDVLPLMFTEN